MKAIVCGGREFTDEVAGFVFLDTVHASVPITHVIEGGARGADTIARNWAKSRSVPVTTVPADWGKYGKSAGFIRNKAMRDEHSPQIVLAMPGGVGTESMMSLARQKNIRVIQMHHVIKEI